MPLPTPAKDEKEDEFIGRCVNFVFQENPELDSAKIQDRKQAVAMCYSTWRRAKGIPEPKEALQLVGKLEETVKLPKEGRLYLFSNSLLLEGKKVHGVAIHPMATYHPYEFPKVRIYLDDYLERAAPTAIGKPFKLDHKFSLAPENKITKNVWNREKSQVEYEGDVSDDVAAMIESGKIKGVSVGLDFTKPGGGMLITEKGVIPYAFGFEEYSFLRDMEPGDPQAWVKIAEAMETQEFTVVKIKDVNAFKDDSFRETWLNQDLGIKIVHGILKDGGESYVPVHLMFYKIKGWTSEKIEVWLRDNPQYSPITQAAVVIGSEPATPIREIKIN